MRAVRGSKGHFSIEGWVRDARAVIDAVRSTDGLQALPLALIGSSGGGAVACEVVARGAPVDALAMLAAPASWVGYATDARVGIRRITQETGMALAEEVVADPTAWMAEFETVTPERAIVKVGIPTLIVHGTADDVVPVDHARRLAERAPRAEVRIIEGGGHQLRREEAALEIVFGWLDRTLR
jgi:alpha-beta hydrolase superfamily lysophospholipase